MEQGNTDTPDFSTVGYDDVSVKHKRCIIRNSSVRYVIVVLTWWRGELHELMLAGVRPVLVYVIPLNALC